MCEMSCSMMEHNSKEGQLKHILSENMRMIPEKDEVDKYGPFLSVDPDDWDDLHIEEHQAFIDSSKLKPQFKSRMQSHIQKHKIQKIQKERLGIKNKEHKSEDKDHPKSEMDMEFKEMKEYA